MNSYTDLQKLQAEATFYDQMTSKYFQITTPKYVQSALLIVLNCFCLEYSAEGIMAKLYFCHCHCVCSKVKAETSF